jgi:hypothetical protein
MSVDALMMRQGLADIAASARLNSEQLRRDYQDLGKDYAALLSTVKVLEKRCCGRTNAREEDCDERGA